ncbi:MAG TPA: isoprenylcysteine carboxylmethyltransferase family protein [Steroidobacteraceae bacterium]|nr:isoprenylcysteine carboxylmethyltransferase family protein [Steroidobacteraceae bacterium]
MRLIDFYEIFFPTLWLAWMITWWVFAINVKTTVRRQPLPSRLLNMVLLWGAFGLLFVMAPLPWPLNVRFVPFSEWQFWAAFGAALTLVGLLFTVWARVYLGRNWSGMFATIKADHELITGGPYALVRHPIYSGLMLAVIGTALAIGQWRGVFATVLAFIAIVHRMRVEEGFMRAQFGGAYDDYARRVPAFVPGVI